jgi:hypothetical protein
MKQRALFVILLLEVVASGVAADGIIQAYYSPKGGCSWIEPG